MELSKTSISKCRIENNVKSSEILNITNSIIMTHAGIYIYNFVTVEILKRIEHIMHFYLKKANAIQVRFPTLQHSNDWKNAGRENGYGDETFVIQDKDNKWFLAPTAEEQACLLVKSMGILSYRQLPLLVYQISEKYRNEIRPRGGLLRSKAFDMMDLYSFCSTKYEQQNEYLKMINIYIQIFNECGLNGRYIISFTDDTGEIGGSLSHEFLVLCDDGDRELFMEPHTYTKFNTMSELNSHTLKPSVKSYKYIEAGHLFDLEQLYSNKMNIQFQSQANISIPYYMGCYGIGNTRLLQIIMNDTSISYLPMCLSPCFVYIVARDIFDEYKQLCNIFGNANVWLNNTTQTLSEKIRLRTYLKLPIMIVYDNGTYELHYLNEKIMYINLNEIIYQLQKIMNDTNYVDLNHFKNTY